MILGIDASNIRRGGGITHLAELLRAADPAAHGFTRVVVWSGRATLGKIEDRPWLVKVHLPLLDGGLLHRAWWQRFRLSTLARSAGCDVLFVPGGAFAGDFHPAVTMSRNLLPFEWQELRKFGWSWMTLKLLLLRFTQTRCFQRAAGVIFLTNYARDIVLRVIQGASGRITIIPHGIDKRFVRVPREQMPIAQYSVDRPFRILYVSIVDMYKHQWNVAEAVALLRSTGLPVMLELIGPAYPAALKLLQRTLNRVDRLGEFVRYSGAVSYCELPAQYGQADLCLFASSCENMPNILLEGMASGLPVACSNRGPMPEVLGNGGVYFDPEDPLDITRCLREFIQSPGLRTEKAKVSSDIATVYSWERCAKETFKFLTQIASDTRH